MMVEVIKREKKRKERKKETLTSRKTLELIEETITKNEFL